MEKSLPLIIGPCVIEGENFVIDVAGQILESLKGLPVNITFKASFDKANRSSIDGFRGPGLKEGVRILERVKKEFGLPVLTDFHTPDQALQLAPVIDALQIPAFLCRQTDMIVEGAHAALKYGRKLNIKKGQFLSAEETANILGKVKQVEARDGKKFKPGDLTITERGSSFGYRRLIVDMAGFRVMRGLGLHTIYDATHSVQLPGGKADGTGSDGLRANIEVLAFAAIAAGAQGIFTECHPNPEAALSDGATSFPLPKVRPFIEQVLAYYKVASTNGFFFSAE